MRRKFLGALPVALAAFALVASIGSPAGAATARRAVPIRGVGSDTTYGMMQKLDDLYNGSPGCNVLGTPQVFNGRCYADLPTTTHKENYFHDVASEAYPLGSSNGVTQLCSQGQSGVLPADYARSSRGPRDTDCAGLRFVGYSRDGISWWTSASNTDAPANLTQAQLKLIFTGNGNTSNCATNWSDVGGTSGPITVYTPQLGSGTRSTFDGFVGGDSSACIPAAFKDGGGDDHVIFENNAGPIIANGDASSAIFPYSFGRFVQSGGEGGTLGKVDGVAVNNTTIANGSFPYGRFLYNVYRATTSTLKASAATKSYLGEVNGWLCKPKGSHSINPVTGHNYRIDIENTIKAEGFVPLPVGAIGGGVAGTSHCRVTTL
ncbi:MAG: substrate-binding domain-containing protein [Actinomycetota bacterium]|nr:substrate-binding domain-containing protein [Actinomycetota bacterium]